MKKKLICYTAAILISLLIYHVLLVTGIDLVAFDKSFYADQYKRLNTAETIGISNDELLRVTWELLDYIKDGRDSISDIKAEIKGEVRPVFNERETAHMVDVKALFRFAYRVRAYSILLLAAVLVAAAGKKAQSYFARSFIWTAGVLIVLLSVLFILIKTNFNYYWDQFHYLFFDNDLWQLNPETDIMILMVPEPFFNSAVTRVLAYFTLGNLTLAAVSAIHIALERRSIRTARDRGQS